MIIESDCFAAWKQYISILKDKLTLRYVLVFLTVGPDSQIHKFVLQLSVIPFPGDMAPSCHCDKLPYKNNLKKQGIKRMFCFVLASSSQNLSWQGCHGSRNSKWSTQLYPQSRSGEPWLQMFIILFLMQSCSSAMEWRVFHFNKPIYKNSHWYVRWYV